MNIKLQNHNAPTPAKLAKLGSALTAAGATISTYCLTNHQPVIGYIGLGFAVFGVILTTLTA